MLTREQIAEVACTENRHHGRIHETFAYRDQSREGFEAWKGATSAWHAQSYPTDFLWSDEFMLNLRRSEREAIEESILYLEVDPWYFRSGYLKERLIRGLRSAELTERDALRLRNVIWNVAAGQNRREYRDFCSLAVRVATEEFREKLGRVSPEEDARAKGKFSFLREYLIRNKPTPKKGRESNG